ncbi:MAG: hypothetical protein ACREPV_08250 [Lysobacter sp.]
MSLFLCLSCAGLAWLLYRMCSHHPRRWRVPGRVGAAAIGLFAAVCWLVARDTGTGLAVAVFIVLTLSMLWLTLVPLLATWWRHRRATGHGA